VVHRDQSEAIEVAQMSVEKAEPRYLTWDDLRWLQERVDRMGIKIRLLVRILVDKKIIGEELAKTFEETSLDKEKLLEWFVEKIKSK